MNVLKLGLGIMMTAVLGFTAVGCSNKDKETQNSVDAANSDLKRMDVIDSELRKAKVYVGSSSLSEDRIHQMDETELSDTEKLVTEFLNRGRNVIDTAGRENVSYPTTSLVMVKKWVGSATEILEVIAERRGDLEAGDAVVTQVEPAIEPAVAAAQPTVTLGTEPLEHEQLDSAELGTEPADEEVAN